MDKVIPNQIDAFKQHIANERIEILNSFIDELDTIKAEEAKIRVQERIKRMQDRTDEKMQHGIDIGGIMKCVVIPHDIVKIEYENGTSCFCFAIKQKGAKKSVYYYADQYIGTN